MKACWHYNGIRCISNRATTHTGKQVNYSEIRCISNRATAHTGEQVNTSGKDQRSKMLSIYKREFLDLVKSRIDRAKTNRTMSMRNRPFVNPSSMKGDVSQTEIPAVDCIVGILSSSKKPLANTPAKSYQGQREMSKNRERKFKKLAEHSFYTAKDSVPIQCQYTKELEARENRAEDKLLKFPLDNESIVWEESHVPFTDHIFLHKYITLFPPETHRFMETVISALQNNPDLTVEKKKVIIWSYLNYFTYNSHLLEEEDEEILAV